MGREAKCPVSGKRKYATEGEALATAAHQIEISNAPKDLRAYLCSWWIPGTSRKVMAQQPKPAKTVSAADDRSSVSRDVNSNLIFMALRKNFFLVLIQRTE